MPELLLYGRDASYSLLKGSRVPQNSRNTVGGNISINYTSQSTISKLVLDPMCTRQLLHKMNKKCGEASNFDAWKGVYWTKFSLKQKHENYTTWNDFFEQIFLATIKFIVIFLVSTLVINLITEIKKRLECFMLN